MDIKKTVEQVMTNLPPTSEGSPSATTPAQDPSRKGLETGNLKTRWQRIRMGLEVITPGVQVMADEVAAWCRRVSLNTRNSGRLLVLSGAFGCGKTVMLQAAVGYLQDIRMIKLGDTWKSRPMQIMTVMWPDFLHRVLELKSEDAMQELKDADVIFLDDIGAETDRFKSGEPARVLGDVLSFVDAKFVFITMNVPPDQWATVWDGRVEDRLLRNGSVIVNGYDPETLTTSYAQHRI